MEGFNSFGTSPAMYLLAKGRFFYELLSPLQKLTTEHIECTERVSFMNFCHKAHVTQPYFQ